MKKLMIVALLSWSVTNIAFAEVPSRASIEHLAKLAHVEDTLEQTFRDSFVLSASEMMVVLIQKQNPQATPAQLEEVRQLVRASMSEVAKQLLWDHPEFKKQALNAYVNTYVQNHTQAEIDALIGFYETPEGSAIAKKQAQVQQQFARALLPYSNAMGQDFIKSDENKALFIELGEKIGKILRQ